MAHNELVLPEGCREAKLAVIIICMVGEVVQGGLFFGWNALAIMIKDLDNFSSGCPTDSDELCKSQESKLAVLWTCGIFALNCGPVLVGFVLDYLGPKFTCILGCLLNMLGLVLFGCSKSSGPNAFVPASIFLGLGGITFHLAQVHASALYPQKRGLLTSVFVAGFTGSGIVFYLLLLIFEGAGKTRAAYTGVLVGYGGLCLLWVPLAAWMMPNEPFQVGQVSLLNRRWRFIVRQRRDLEITYARSTSYAEFEVSSAGVSKDAEGPQAAPGGASLEMTGAAMTTQLVGGAPDSSNPFWIEEEEAAEARRQRSGPIAAPLPTTVASPRENGRHSNGLLDDGIPVAPGGRSLPAPGQNLVNMQLMGPATERAQDAEEGQAPPQGVVWGPLVFEARRFVELRKLSFFEQFKSSESFGMGCFYTLCVFTMQFYLGTMRLQLSHKGNNAETYSNFGNVVVAFAFLLIPVIGWLLDKKGYGATLGTILALSVLTLVLQATPTLPLQVFTITVWMIARFFMYASYFAIFGALFGFRNFGRLVAVDNLFNGLFGLLQYPLTYLAIHPLNGNFLIVNLSLAACLLPLSWFCYAMYKWEREDLVPIRPLEGEELPCDMLGPQQRKKIADLHLPNLHLSEIRLPHVQLPEAIRKLARPGSNEPQRL